VPGRADHGAVAAQTARPSILWIAPLTDHSGYADEARGFLRALERAGHRPAARERRWRDSDAGLGAADRAMVRKQLARAPRDPVVAVHHHIPNGEVHVVENAVNVARTMFETDSIPARWVPELLERDEIWVPSRHNAESFRSAGIPASKLRVIGGTLDFDLFSPGADPLPVERRKGEVLFVANFDFSERKGWRTLLRAWARAFHRHDPVRLLLKTGSFQNGDRHVRERIDGFLRAVARERPGEAAPVTVLTDTLGPDELPRLYAAADAYVMPSHGEGWGRPLMEALAMGLPSIASRWSGPLEFMEESSSWLIDGQLVPVPLDAEPYFGAANGHRWFEPDVDALVAALRDIAADPRAARARAAGARRGLLERHGPEPVAARIAAAVEELVERHGPGRSTGVVMRGPFGSTASLAVANDHLADALSGLGRRVRHRAQAVGSLGEEVPGFTHSWPPNFEPVTDGPTVVCLPWEYGSPPAEWVEEVTARVDRVWAPSAYVRDGYVAAGMPPNIVEVVPYGVDTERYTPGGPRFGLPRSAACVFLFVGGTIWRKGVDILLAAWQEAFGAADDVLLIVKDFGAATHYRGQTDQQTLRWLAARDDIAPVVYLEDDLAPDALPSLYRAADVLVAPYRGEGFCLPALEAMSCGVPVIHTGAGPTGEFVPPGAGWALPSRPVGFDTELRLPRLAGPASVLEVDRAALVAALRDAARDPAGRMDRGRAAHDAALRRTWRHAAAIAERSLHRLEAERLPPARTVVPARVEGHDEIVLYAPDWESEAAWAPPLLSWAEAFGPQDPVTLALHVPSGDPEQLGERILAALRTAGHDDEALPDLALCEPGAAGIAALVARAGAVLLGAGDDGRPELTRRARRLLRPTAADLRAFAADVRAQRPLAAAG
jgi:glycosyltransferase involved in cell wall biosynthesis